MAIRCRVSEYATVNYQLLFTIYFYFGEIFSMVLVVLRP